MSLGETKSSLLSRIQSRLWPIQRFELGKIVPLLLMKFFISLTYGVLTSMKDAFVVTAKGSGAEVIPVLKGWIVLPAAFGATLLYSKLSNMFKRTTIFNGIIVAFMAFLFIYGFVLYPNLDALSPHVSADKLIERFGIQNAHWVSVYRNWVPSLFFVVAELWGQIVIFLLFWGFVNHICNFNEAKRCYNLFIAGGDLAQILTGTLVVYITRQYAAEHFDGALQTLILFVLFFGSMILLLHWWLNRNVMRDARLYQPENNIAFESKTKLSLVESIKLIMRSKYLRQIAIMVVSYGLIMNLTEVTWKANLKFAYPDPGSYQSFMATISSSVGVCSLLISLFLSGIVIRRLGWRFCAQLPPIVIGITSLTFLLMYLNQQWFSPLSAVWGFSPLMLVVLFGAFQNISSKVMKYAFFDATKEMAYIPLDQESKVKGKAAIDVVGSRLGKSGAAWLQLLLIQFVGTGGSILSITYLLLPMIVTTLVFWILSVRSLSQEVVREGA